MCGDYVAKKISVSRCIGDFRLIDITLFSYTLVGNASDEKCSGETNSKVLH